MAELTRIGFEVDPFELQYNRRLVMRGEVDTPRGRTKLIVIYPDSFPFLRPEVFAPDLGLERHRNPYEHNLCLLDRSTAEWSVHDTGAWLVREQVPHLLELLEQGGDALLVGEAPQGEPASAYFRGHAGTIVFVPEAALHIDPTERTGLMELSVRSNEAATPRLRALLKRVTAKGDRSGRVLACADDTLSGRFDGTRLQGRWVRLDELPDDNTPRALLAAATAACPEAAKPRFQTVVGAQLAVIGCVLSEEVEQGRWEDGWLFVVVHRHATGPRSRSEGALIVRGDRLTRTDLSARTPHLAALADKHVAVLGLGGLGAPIAIELARAGIGRLSLLDGDVVEVGNIIRWPIGLSAAGHRKVDAIGGWLGNEYPLTEVRCLDGRVGAAPTPTDLGKPRDRSELDLLADLLDDADLIIDATAELGMQHLTEAIGADHPRVYTWATEGAVGGAVVRLGTGPACWLCLQHSLTDGSVPLPPADEQATIQPRGCASRTFTGAAFDLAPVANQSVRVAVATLLGTSSAAHDISILALRDTDGTMLPAPRWHTQPLEPHIGCDVCGSSRVA